MKLLTLDDYKKAGDTFWEKYWYVAKELGGDAKTEDILKIMESLGAVALKLRLEEDKVAPFGFKKDTEDLQEDDVKLESRLWDQVAANLTTLGEMVGVKYKVSPLEERKDVEG